jgi:predicted RNA-binding Zn-ribbon protein involved in translation (DUF1610 family)
MEDGMPTCFGLRKSHPRKSVTTTDCPYCGAAANLVRLVLHPELGLYAALTTFDCVDCGPWSEIAAGTGLPEGLTMQPR